jgi:hypothetical protein
MQTSQTIQANAFTGRINITGTVPGGTSGLSGPHNLTSQAVSSVGQSTTSAAGSINISTVFVRFTVVLYNTTLQSFSVEAQVELKRELAVASGLNSSSWRLINLDPKVFGSGVLISVKISLVDTESAERVVSFLRDHLNNVLRASEFSPAEAISIPRVFQSETFEAPSLAFFYPAVSYAASISFHHCEH